MISKEDLIEAQVQETLALQQIAYKEEKANIYELGRKNGMESLTTDTSGHRSAEWFRDSGKVFATGVASNCLIVAITHPNVGMAASHRNSVHEDILRKVFRSIADGSMHSYGSRAIDEMLTMGDLDDLVKKTVGEAVKEFAQLNQSELTPEQLSIVVTGLDFTTVSMRPFITDAFQTGLYSALGDDIFSSLRGEPFQAQIRTGIGEGLLYGGAHHPNYRELTPYTFGYQNPK